MVEFQIGGDELWLLESEVNKCPKPLSSFSSLPSPHPLSNFQSQSSSIPAQFSPSKRRRLATFSKLNSASEDSREASSNWRNCLPYWQRVAS